MIELRDVSIHAGQFSLKNASFIVPTGVYGVLMGKTGRGKTTILETICGLRQVQSGRVLLHGTDVTDWSPADRRVGYVPQDLALFPTLTVQQHLEFAMRLQKTPHAEMNLRVRELSDVLGISHLLARRVQKLSGGESQRVALGRALAFRPAVLLLDEPLSALDETTRQDMHALLRKLKDSWNVTTLHVTHSTEEADALADLRLVLQNGAIQSV